MFDSGLGFLGAGRMATALARGCVQAGLIAADRVIASDPWEAARLHFGEHLPGARMTASNADVLAAADVVVVAVKPQTIPALMAEIGPLVESRHLLASIAAGIRLSKLAAVLPAGARLVRVMPNTPCLIGRGTSCFAVGEHATAADGELVAKLLESVGAAHKVEESSLDAVTGLSGSGPAFVYAVIEALAQGGCEAGLSLELALTLAAETTAGAAEMVISTGLSPSALRDQVTSPGGTTLAGLEALGRSSATTGLRDAVVAAARRSVELGRT